MKIQIMAGKVCLRCKGKTLLGVVKKLLKIKKSVENAQQCFAFAHQASFPSHNLNFHWMWRWLNRIQATFEIFFTLLNMFTGVQNMEIPKYLVIEKLLKSSYAVHFFRFRYKMILNCPNCFGQVQIILVGSKLFW